MQLRFRLLTPADGTPAVDPTPFLAWAEGAPWLKGHRGILWIARIRSNLKEQRDLEYDGYLTHDEYKTLSESVSSEPEGSPVRDLPPFYKDEPGRERSLHWWALARNKA